MSHSRYAPSSAHRWVVCQESLKPLPDHLKQYARRDDEDDDYSRDGSAKHSLSAWAINGHRDPVDALLEDIEFHGLTPTTDMVEAAAVYVTAIRDLLDRDPSYNQMWIEDRVYMPSIHEEMSGQLDCAIFSELKEHLIIGDAKFGWELVEPGWQGRSYAIGKVAELEDLGYTISKITHFICQPADKHEPIKLEVLTREELRSHEKTLKKATKGKSIKAGDHCKYCPRAAVPGLCAALEGMATEAIPNDMHSVQDFDEMIVEMTPQQVADVLDRQEAFKIWFAACANWAKRLLLLNTDVPGYYLHDGQGNRSYIDANVAEKVLLEKYGDGIYEARTLRSPAQIEKIWPNAKVLMNGHGDQPGLCTRPKTGYTLKRKEQ